MEHILQSRPHPGSPATPPCSPGAGVLQGRLFFDRTKNSKYINIALPPGFETSIVFHYPCLASYCSHYLHISNNNTAITTTMRLPLSNLTNNPFDLHFCNHSWCPKDVFVTGAGTKEAMLGSTDGPANHQYNLGGAPCCEQQPLRPPALGSPPLPTPPQGCIPQPRGSYF